MASLPRLFRVMIGALCALALASCAPSDPSSEAVQTGSDKRVAASPRTLVMVVRYEVSDLLPKIPGPSSPSLSRRLFNADLALIDGAGIARPYLAESLPEVNTGRWRLLPEGRMETTYVLRPGLTWHDGTPLTADDFSFAYRLYNARSLGLFTPSPQDQMEQVRAVDARTLVIDWRSLYPEAGALVDQDFEPLPRHILEAPFAAYEDDPVNAREAFVAHRFWSSEYVGLGPFRLTRWEPGAFLEGVAFDGHALGRPKIDRVQLRAITDENATLSNVLARDVHFTARLALRFEHGVVLLREWAQNGRGLVFLEASPTVTAAIQFRPEYVQSPPLMDLRVRRAMAYTVDKASLNDGLFESSGLIGYGNIAPELPYWADADRAMTKYPYDPRRAEQQMGEAGFVRDREGFFTSQNNERFRPAFWVTSGPLFERQLALMSETWQRAGFDVQPYVIPAAQTRDNEIRSTFPGLLSHGVTTNPREMLETLTANQVPTAANRWRGSNRSGWSHPEYERLWDVFNQTLDRPARERLIVEMAKFESEMLPRIMLFYNMSVISHLDILKGPTTATPDTLPYWNLHEWELVG